MSREARVVAALIETAPGRYLVQQRLPGKSRALLWEFPGGKVEPGETDGQALIREAREELGVLLQVGEERFAVRHTYQDLTVDLHLYAARIVEGTPAPLGARALRGATPQEMLAMPFCEADLPLLRQLASEDQGRLRG
ncbi:MAG TPA: (deoxy)nucleoside triphosphate pyrophosphohydrolase [Myxococcaceae bacterium]|nr:(deoxy)nucleoside triphosphate pyrophosphohydrolase [Myxococcaceae bacterium]